MRATVLEIHKRYCIVVTTDGQFLKKRIPAAKIEIGDEVIIEKLADEKSKGHARIIFHTAPRAVVKTAVGFATVIIIIIGAYFGIKYIGLTEPAAGIAMAEEAGQKQELNSGYQDPGESFIEGTKTGEVIMSGKEKEAGGVPLDGEATMRSIEELFSGTFSLEDAGDEIVIKNDLIFISYMINELKKKNGEGIPDEEKLRELTIKFKNIKKDSLLNGNADVMLLYSDKSISEIEKILFDSLNYEQQNTRKIPFSQETSFELMVFGVFR